MHFVIVDDDKGVVQILKNIISEYNLGTVIGSCNDGVAGEKMIRELRPSIALIDLLMPKRDGVAMLDALCDIKDQVSFVVISENSSQALLSMVYERGIEYYIHKPINVVEVVSVIKKTAESRQLKQFLNMAAQGVHNANSRMEEAGENQKRKLQRLLHELGIAGENGSEAIQMMVSEMYEQPPENAKSTLADLYKKVSEVSGQDVKTIEQRVRRAISKALTNLASIGLEDFYNERFQEYNNVLFEFKEVRQEMTFLQDKSPYRGKINIRKFIEGLLFLSSY